MGWPRYTAIIASSGVAYTVMPWWAALTMGLALVLSGAYERKWRYQFGKHALDKAQSRYVGEVTKAIVQDSADGRWHQRTDGRRLVTEHVDRQTSAVDPTAGPARNSESGDLDICNGS